MEITQSYLLGKFIVINGVLHRKISTGEMRPMNSYDALGYVRIKVLGKVVYAHRMVFLMSNGFLPEYVDHIDGNPKNNDPMNLRAATPSDNNCNRKIGSNNTSGFKGVSFHKESGRWISQVSKNGVVIRKSCSSLDDAMLHSQNARRQLHKSFVKHA